ncbi:hypothetical protein WN51_11845 [Melipona quadrifasciata]|uniref:Uncharacterized protein n=1 Tax=Melipona quadrifasciata TaxID=166423 RepID=A0A0M9A589_9HYME|nr:hypothetical protein WN51_11845 [Melipona quadrifasciata]
MTTRSNTRAQMNEGSSTGSSTEFKLVPFWPERLELWFLRAEQKFASRNITSGTTINVTYSKKIIEFLQYEEPFWNFIIKSIFSNLNLS